MTKQSLGAMERGPSAYGIRLLDVWGARMLRFLKFESSQHERECLRFLKFEPSRLFVCQRTCHPVRGLVVGESCRLKRHRFGNRTNNDG